MLIRAKFVFEFCVLLVLLLQHYFTSGTRILSLNDPIRKQLTIINAFTGCNVRVINFKGSTIDFELIQIPVILLRYISYCGQEHLYPFELGPEYSALKIHNLSNCPYVTTENLKLPSDQLVTQSLTDSFQLTSKNKDCEANVYLDPPTEQESPELYSKNRFWNSILKNPVSTHTITTKQTLAWKYHYFNTVSTISLLICGSAEESIYDNENDVKKWIAGVIYSMYRFPILSFYILVWESPSLQLKTICPYCDPCDSFKTIPIHTNIGYPTSKSELQTILQKIHQQIPFQFVLF